MRFFTLCFLIFIVMLNDTAAQSKLSYNLNPGDTFKVYQSTKQDILQEMEGQKHEMTSLIDGDFTFVVNSVNDTLIEFTFRFDRLKMQTNSNLAGEVISVDTNKKIEETDIMGKLLSELVDVDLQMLMFKNGKIKEVKGADNLINKMVNSLPYFHDAAAKKQVKQAMAEDFSSESLADSFEQMTFIYSGNQVSINDSWENDFKGELSSKNTWTLKKLNPDSAEIEGNGEVVFKTEDASISMNLTGTMVSQITTSLDTGFIKEMSVRSDASGNSVIKQMSGTNVPTTVVTNTSYKINYVQ